ncbi:MAG TPA: patatin-like phospholipase family protein [Cyclobacteriaceae bacterium]|jgi:NTE family protein|nr:patatin-like phospholipase family protein [Cyclobacteriaceae bacterium]
MRLKQLFSASLLLSSILLKAQPYKNLVFEGAGIRGVAYVGAIKELESRSVLADIDKVGGTSAGAIAALTVTLGYASSEIESIIYNTRLQKFNDGRYFFIGGITRLNRNYGWYQGKAFTHWLEKIIYEKTGDAEITFRELHEMNFRDLYVTGTSLNHQKLIVFSYETYPNMKVKDAVRISMSIPLYFEAICIDSAGRVVNGRTTTGYYDIMVDGGFTGNFPISLFDSTTTSNGYFQRDSNLATLGLRIDSPQQIDYDTMSKGLAPIQINHFGNYISAFYNYVLENLNRTTLTQEDWKRTVSISSGMIGARIRRLSVAEKNSLINNGQQAMKSFLDQSSVCN